MPKPRKKPVRQSRKKSRTRTKATGRKKRPVARTKAGKRARKKVVAKHHRKPRKKTLRGGAKVRVSKPTKRRRPTTKPAHKTKAKVPRARKTTRKAKVTPAFKRAVKHLSGHTRAAHERRGLYPGSHLVRARRIENPHGGYQLVRTVALLFENSLLEGEALRLYRPWLSRHITLFRQWVKRRVGRDTPPKVSTKVFYSIGSIYRQQYTVRESYGFDVTKIVAEQTDEVKDMARHYQPMGRGTAIPLRLDRYHTRIVGFEINLATITLGRRS